MKPKIFQLFLFHLIFFFLFYELRITLEDQNFEELNSWLEFKDGLLNLSSLINFFWYSLGAYLVLLFFYKKSLIKVVLGFIATIFLTIGFRFFIEEIFYQKVFGFDNYNDNMSFLFYCSRNSFYAILHLCVGIVFFFFQYSKHKDKQEQMLLLENKKTELAYLRSQVNPHFLFNTLNNVYSLVYQKSEKALPAIEKLTSMLRYSLYEGGNKIELKKEIDCIENFISLERMRYAYPLEVDFKTEIHSDNFKIPPLLLLPFVENAFKHGDMKSPLIFHILSNKDELIFIGKNKIKEKQKDAVGGIGLENIKKRLEIIYDEKHDLKIEKDNSFFSVELKIKK